MTAKRAGLVLLPVVSVFLNSCAMRIQKPPDMVVSERWAIVDSGVPGEKYVVIRDSKELEKTLVYLGCKKHPCTIGRLGDLYVVSEPTSKVSKQ
jgi:hypothetical protein